MKLGIFTVALYSMDLKTALDYLKKNNVQMCEIGCGGNPGKIHCNPEILLNDKSKLDEFKNTIKDSGIEISALSTHCNPVHPNKEIAREADKDLHNAVLMAEALELHQINTFSGCPGDCENSKYPNWVTAAWPDDFQDVLKYQWDECLIPYWKEFVKFAVEHGVDKIAFEPHPGFCVYNPKTMLKIREAVGPQIGANFDPSHMFWQGIDPVEAIYELKDAIFHFHAKDTQLYNHRVAVNGVLDTQTFDKYNERNWIFRTVGYGHDLKVWKDIISALKAIGYDYVISIEHEDILMSLNEGLVKACEFLNSLLIKEQLNEDFHL